MRCPKCEMGHEIESPITYDGDGRPWHAHCAGVVLSTWRNGVEQHALREQLKRARLVVVRMLADQEEGGADARRR